MQTRVAESVGHIAGVRVEDKPAGLAVHVRAMRRGRRPRALELIRALAVELPGTFALEGKLVIELSTRPLDKGAALRGLIAIDASTPGAVRRR